MSDVSDVSDKEGAQAQGRRRKIRKIIETGDLALATQEAANKEYFRKKRIDEKEKPNFEDTSQLILDFKKDIKRPIIEVDEGLVKELKPHQREGIRFLWNCCFESIEIMDDGDQGSGCILAHCMGLGKSLQVVTLIHTLLAQSEKTKVHRVLILAPLNTVTNWEAEFNKWLPKCHANQYINVVELSMLKDDNSRAAEIEGWYEGGGVLILGYERFRNLTNEDRDTSEKNWLIFQKCLLNPGPELVVCDEGHILKSDISLINMSVNNIKTERRIILTGTPLQNNLIEYYCMIQFVKPNLLGNKQEYANMFVNPIANGQYFDSTADDIALMKQRSHILHSILDGFVQRRDASVLVEFLPSKEDHVIFVAMSELQEKLYKHYINTYSAGNCVFRDFNNLQRIWTHPLALKFRSDQQGEMSQIQILKGEIPLPTGSIDVNWWKQICSEKQFDILEHGSKLMLLFSIIADCQAKSEKLLVFSQSLFSLGIIKHFLAAISENTKNPDPSAKLGGFTGEWTLGKDFFCLDGSIDVAKRTADCNQFNDTNNKRARLFLISTRAGGLGINLIAASTVVILDASWNPSHDSQSIFRIYRLGQKNPCKVYRLIAYNTMEEQIYKRQILKLATSKRVVDEQQIDRHYIETDVSQLYKFDEDAANQPPKTYDDQVENALQQIVKNCRHLIVAYEDHDALLENRAGEVLTTEEIDEAWKEFQENKEIAETYTATRLTVPNPAEVQPIDVYCFRSDELLQLIKRKAKIDYPARDPNDKVPIILAQYHSQMANDIRIIHDDLLKLRNNPNLTRW